jgi:hypothetical protein
MPPYKQRPPPTFYGKQNVKCCACCEKTSSKAKRHPFITHKRAQQEEQTNQQTNQQANKPTNEQANKPTNQQTNKPINQQTNKPTNQQTNKQMLKTNKPTNKQTHRLTHTHTHTKQQIHLKIVQLAPTNLFQIQVRYNHTNCVCSRSKSNYLKSFS